MTERRQPFQLWPSALNWSPSGLDYGIYGYPGQLQVVSRLEHEQGIAGMSFWEIPQYDATQGDSTAEATNQSDTTMQGSGPAQPTLQIEEESIDEKDIYGMCRELTCEPLRTQCECNRTFCKFCVTMWMTMSSHFGVDEEEQGHIPLVMVQNGLELFEPLCGAPDPISRSEKTSCPLCRKEVSMKHDKQLAGQLMTKYPRTYSRRLDDTLALILSMTILPSGKNSSGSVNRWEFLLLPSHPEIIDRVEFGLRNSYKLVLPQPEQAPYTVEIQNSDIPSWQRGWYEVDIFLKPGYTWTIDAGCPTSQNCMRVFWYFNPAHRHRERVSWLPGDETASMLWLAVNKLPNTSRSPGPGGAR